MTAPFDPRHPAYRPVGGGVDSLPRPRVRMRRAYLEFFRTPLAMLAAFGVLSLVTVFLDLSRWPVLVRIREPIDELIPTDSAVGLLTQIAPAVLAVASLTFSVLLVAVQQNAAVYAPIIFDQFLRRRGNQMQFGFFLGVAFYAFILLAAVRPSNKLAFASIILLILTMLSLVMLVILIYGTVNQMRPSSVLSDLRDVALTGRAYRRRHLLSRVRAEPLLPPTPSSLIHIDGFGFIVDIDLDVIEAALVAVPSEVEVVFQASIGTHLSPGDVVGHVRGEVQDQRELVAQAVGRAVMVDQHRDFHVDPAYAMGQLAGMAWNGYAQHSPSMGLITMSMFTDIFKRWMLAPPPRTESSREPLAVAYPDAALLEVIDNFTAITMVAVPSLNPRPCVEVMLPIADILPFLDDERAGLLEDRLWRILPALETFTIIPVNLENAARRLAASLHATGRHDLAQRLQDLIDERIPVREGHRD